MGSKGDHESGCGVNCPWPFGGWGSKNAQESHVEKPPSFSKQQHEEQKASEKVEDQHVGVEAKVGETNKEDGQNVDKEAEYFIGRMKSAMRAERLKSIKRFQSMLNRGT